MPTVDFTLEQLLEATGRQTRQIIREEFKPLFNEAFDEAFEPAFLNVLEPHMIAIKEDFGRLEGRLDKLEGRFDRLDRKVDRLADQTKNMKHIVDLHSTEILELKARPA
jgi:predicted nuclease with TOPRIM domain